MSQSDTANTTLSTGSTEGVAQTPVRESPPAPLAGAPGVDLRFKVSERVLVAFFTAIAAIYGATVVL